MLVTPYMRFFIGSNSPMFEVGYREAAKMRTRYPAPRKHLDQRGGLAPMTASSADDLFRLLTAPRSARQGHRRPRLATGPVS